VTALTSDWNALSFDFGGRSGAPLDARTIVMARPRSPIPFRQIASMSTVSSMRNSSAAKRAARRYITSREEEHPHRRAFVLGALGDYHASAAFHEPLHFGETDSGAFCRAPSS